MDSALESALFMSSATLGKLLNLLGLHSLVSIIGVKKKNPQRFVLKTRLRNRPRNGTIKQNDIINHS